MCVNRDIEHEFAVWALRFIDKFGESRDKKESKVRLKNCGMRKILITN
jgi:hypothetical protein